MRPLLGGVLTIALVLMSITDDAYALSNREIVENYQNTVVFIEYYELGDSEPSSLASGVMYTKQRLVTNAHVVGELPETTSIAKDIYTESDLTRAEYWVTIAGTKYRARFVGRDVDVDLAVLELEHPVETVVPAKFGDSDDVRPGDRVLAFGNPLGFENTVTEGIVSALEREISFLSYSEHIQIDAPTSPGNSGGAIVSTDTGLVIGIHDAGVGGADGLGFCIPINLFKDMEPNLKETIKHSWVGIKFPVEDMVKTEGFRGLREIHELTGLNNLGALMGVREVLFGEARGIIITDIMRDHVDAFYSKNGNKNTDSDDTDRRTPPAHKAGLEIGDIIQKWGEHDISSSRDLIRAIFYSKPHKPVTVTVLRYNDRTGTGRSMNFEIKPILRNPKGVGEGFY